MKFQEDRQNCIITSFIISALSQIVELNDQAKKGEIGRA
jgi:hypothetical protein